MSDAQRNGNNVPFPGRREKKVPTADEKLEAVKMVWAGQSKASVARKLGYPESTLRGWCKHPQKIMMQATGRPTTIQSSAQNAIPPAKRPRTSDDEPLDLTLKSGEGSTSSSECSNVFLDCRNTNMTASAIDNACQSTETTISERQELLNIVQWNNMLSKSWLSQAMYFSKLLMEANRRFAVGTTCGSDTNLSSPDVEQPFRLEDAITHGENFLQCLTSCRNFSIGTSEVDQVAILVNKLKTILEEQNSTNANIE